MSDQGETIRAGAEDETLPQREGPTPLAGDGKGGRRIGRYPVTGHLGAGGMGEVLEVTDPALGRSVAAKVIRGQADDHALRKFAQEAQVTGQLEHPGIVPVYELGRDRGGQHYFTMKRVEGSDLGGILDEEREAAEGRGEPRSMTELLRILLRVCEAMAFAHSRKVIHRDLKPDNIMVGAFGEVLVMDWGLARLLGRDEAAVENERTVMVTPGAALPADDDPLKTLDGTILGTPSYMPPEQAEGKIAELDQRSDVYALGAILYEMLTLAPPYVGGTIFATLEMVATGDLVPAERRAPEGREVPWELAAIATRALSRKRHQRYQTVLELKRDIERYLDGRRVSAARYSAIAAMRKWVVRNKHMVQAAAAVLVTALAIGGWWLKTEADRRAARDATIAEARQAVEEAAKGDRLTRAEALLAIGRKAGTLGATPDQLEQISTLISGLRGQSEALAELSRLVPDDSDAVEQRHEVLLAIGRLAVMARDDSLAEFALGQAAQLGVEGSTAPKELRVASKSRLARLERQAKTIRRRLDDAARGRLARHEPYQVALVEIASMRDRQTVDLLVRELDGLTDVLRATTRATLLAVAEPTEAERARGWDTIRQLEPALDDWLGTRVPVSAAGTLRTMIEEQHVDPLKKARGRLEVRERARRKSTSSSRRIRWRELVADAQGRALGKRGPGAVRQVQLICDALGMLNETRGPIDALGRYLWIEEDQLRAVAAGRALARLGARDPRAEAIIRNILGQATRKVRPHKWSANESWGRAIRDERVVAGVDAIGSGSGSAEELTHLEVFRRAQARLAARKYDDALADINRALELDPSREKQCRILRAIILTQSSRLKEARVDLDYLVEHHPSALTWANRAHLFMITFRYEEAVADCTKAIALSKKHAPAFGWRAACLFELGRHDEAFEDAERALRIDGRQKYAMLTKARVQHARRDLDDALVTLEGVLTLDERYAYAFVVRSAVYRSMGRLREARADADRAVELKPGFGRAYFQRARVRMSQGDYVGSEQDYTAALRHHPKADRSLRASAYANRGAARSRLGRSDEAIADFTRAIKLDAGRYAPYVNRGNEYNSRGRTREALRDYDKAIELAPGRAVVWYNRGLVRRKVGRNKDAIADFGKAIALDPKYVKAWYQRGRTKMALGDLDGADRDCDRAIALSPKNAGAYSTRGLIRTRQERYEAAQADFDRAIALSPRWATAWSNRGWHYIRRKKWKQAINSLNQAIALDGRIAYAYFNRAVAWRELGSTDKALKDFDRAVALEPKDRAARRSRGRLRAKAGQVEEGLKDLRLALALTRKARRDASWVLIDLADVLVAAGKKDEAIAELTRALPKTSGSGRERLEKKLAELK